MGRESSTRRMSGGGWRRKALRGKGGGGLGAGAVAGGGMGGDCEEQGLAERKMGADLVAQALAGRLRGRFSGERAVARGEWGLRGRRGPKGEEHRPRRLLRRCAEGRPEEVEERFLGARPWWLRRGAPG